MENGKRPEEYHVSSTSSSVGTYGRVLYDGGGGTLLKDDLVLVYFELISSLAQSLLLSAATREGIMCV